MNIFENILLGSIVCYLNPLSIINYVQKQRLDD